MPAKTMALERVRIAGYQALTRALEPVNLVRFLQQFEIGYGDYTQERHQWLDRYTIEEITCEVQDRREVVQ